MTARGPLGVGADYGDAKVVGANARRHNPRDAIAGFIGRDAGGLVEYCCGPIEYVGTLSSATAACFTFSHGSAMKPAFHLRASPGV